MLAHISFRAGDGESLADEFIQKEQKLKKDQLLMPSVLAEDKILAVHYADAGAQGDPGTVEILYSAPESVRVLYGNYAFGDLDLDAVIQKLPMLKCLDTRSCSEYPYPFGGKVEIPEGWAYLYMGALNHFFVRDEICDKVTDFTKVIMQSGRSWQIFDAVAWFCGAE